MLTFVYNEVDTKVKHIFPLSLDLRHQVAVL